MYNILKSYENKPSKNTVDEKNKTLEEALQYLKDTARMWKDNGGAVIELTNETLIVEEANGSETITFSIVEIDE